MDVFFPPNSIIGLSSTGGVSIGQTSFAAGTQTGVVTLTANGVGSLIVNLSGGYATTPGIQFTGPLADEVASYDSGITLQTNLFIPGN